MLNILFLPKHQYPASKFSRHIIINILFPAFNS